MLIKLDFHYCFFHQIKFLLFPSIGNKRTDGQFKLLVNVVMVDLLEPLGTHLMPIHHSTNMVE